ncbi:hypothetical protein BDZ91DRAFT_768478 [Kalaharituber pfeilii]|nr:hypothetical protein BDZ91DRAFT_768478 [Kalaharituber pfeilii]
MSGLPWDQWFLIIPFFLSLLLFFFLISPASAGRSLLRDFTRTSSLFLSENNTQENLFGTTHTANSSSSKDSQTLATSPWPIIDKMTTGVFGEQEKGIHAGGNSGKQGTTAVEIPDREGDLSRMQACQMVRAHWYFQQQHNRCPHSCHSEGKTTFDRATPTQATEMENLRLARLRLRAATEALQKEREALKKATERLSVETMEAVKQDQEWLQDFERRVFIAIGQLPPGN